jgi:hypothetical protein
MEFDGAETAIADAIAAKWSRKRIVDLYVLCLLSVPPPDWGKINRMIIDRWSISGLIYIKREANKQLQEWSR